MIRSLLDKKLGELNLGKTNSVSQMKLEHFMRSIKEDCLEENDEKSATMQEENKRNQSGISMRNQEKFKETFESFHKSPFFVVVIFITLFLKNLYFTEFSSLSKDLENMKKDFSDNSNVSPLPYASSIVFKLFSNPFVKNFDKASESRCV